MMLIQKQLQDEKDEGEVFQKSYSVRIDETSERAGCLPAAVLTDTLSLLRRYYNSYPCVIRVYGKLSGMGVLGAINIPDKKGLENHFLYNPMGAHPLNDWTSWEVEADVFYISLCAPSQGESIFYIRFGVPYKKTEGYLSYCQKEEFIKSLEELVKKWGTK